MKLYVWSKVIANHKVYINIQGPNRQSLRNHFGGDWFTINDGQSYNVKEVWAEAEPPSGTMAGAIIGGLIGLLGGPEGAIIGAAIGTAIGNNSDQDERKKATAFNSSY